MPCKSCSNPNCFHCKLFGLITRWPVAMAMGVFIGINVADKINSETLRTTQGNVVEIPLESKAPMSICREQDGPMSSAQKTESKKLQSNANEDKK